MFTGIVEEIGTIVSVKQVQNMTEIEINAEIVIEDISLGDSLATDGVCLTVCDISKNIITVTAMPETMKHTTLQYAITQRKVNLERAVQPMGRLGGHIMSGHIDGVEKLLSITGSGLERNYKFSLQSEYAKLVAKKGSIAINGVSLTISEVADTSFTVSLIPFTIEKTILRDLKIGDKVNIEVDIIARYLARLTGNNEEQGLTLERMVELGF